MTISDKLVTTIHSVDQEMYTLQEEPLYTAIIIL